LGKIQEGISWYDEALLLNPRYSNAMGGKASALVTLGKCGEDLMLIDKALAIDPNNTQVQTTKDILHRNPC
jgi:tetratricopeptide (TPR) repeat protein